jgi:uncharacterized membrane protein
VFENEGWQVALKRSSRRLVGGRGLGGVRWSGDQASIRSAAMLGFDVPMESFVAFILASIAMKSRFLEEKYLHLVFEASLVLKAVFAVAEILAGIGAYFVTQQFLFRLVERMTREERLEDPRDFIANYLFQSAQHFSVSTRRFTAVYLLSHGVIKLWLIIGLLRQRLWYYPVAIAIFSLFIAYQLYRYSLTHSLWLLLITVVDVVVIVLTWHEYRYLRAQASP